jgi:hypothetical protein
MKLARHARAKELLIRMEFKILVQIKMIRDAHPALKYLISLLKKNKNVSLHAARDITRTFFSYGQQILYHI